MEGQENLIEAMNILVEDYNCTNFQVIVSVQTKDEKFIKKNLLI